jgi:uncharacterized protein (TIGR00730 family)
MSRIIAVFGSARPKEGDETYQMSYEVGSALAEASYITMTGGFAGVMEAASRGAKEAGGEAYGITVESLGLIGESQTNQWVTKEIRYPNFRERLQHLVNEAHAYVVMPGGIGTLQELIEVWQYMRIGDIPKKPILIYGDFWNGVIEQMLRKAFVGEKDTAYIRKVDSPEAMIDTLQSWFSED